MSEWLALAFACFVICLLCDYLAIKHLYASMEGRALAAALITGLWTGIGAIGLVIAVKVSLWLLLSDVFGHSVGSYLGVKYRKPDLVRSGPSQDHQIL